MIDDGSSDESVDRIRRALLKAPSPGRPVRLITRENRGLIATLNQALALAHGHYLLLIGSDDVLRRSAARILVHELESDPTLGIAGGSFIKMDRRGRHLPSFLAPCMSRKRLAFDELFLCEDYLPAPGMAVRVSALREVGGFDPRFGIEDLPLMLRLIDRGYGILRVADFVSYYRRHDSNMTSDVAQMRRHLESVRAAFSHRPDIDDLMARARRLEGAARPQRPPLRRAARAIKGRLLDLLRRNWTFG